MRQDSEKIPAISVWKYYLNKKYLKNEADNLSKVQSDSLYRAIINDKAYNKTVCFL